MHVGASVAPFDAAGLRIIPLPVMHGADYVCNLFIYIYIYIIIYIVLLYSGMYVGASQRDWAVHHCRFTHTHI